MSENENGRLQRTEQEQSKAIQKNEMMRAGEAANRAVAEYLFTDYRQRHAKKTIQTQERQRSTVK